MELLVAMTIIAILMTAAMYGVRSARTSGSSIAAVTAAHAYADAADSFAREHDGRYPGAPGSEDWAGGAEAAKGPMDEILGERRYYLRRIPEAVQGGSVSIGGSGAAAISYAPSPQGYVITVSVADHAAGPCVILGGTATSTLRTCTKR